MNLDLLFKNLKNSKCTLINTDLLGLLAIYLISREKHVYYISPRGAVCQIEKKILVNSGKRKGYSVI